MLVLARKKNESIVINNDITVTVVEIRGDKVRLGIVAPKEVPVHRQEVFDAIHGKGNSAPDAASGVVPKPVPLPSRTVPNPPPPLRDAGSRRPKRGFFLQPPSRPPFDPVL